MRVATIAVHTFKESVRQKVLYNLVAFALLLIGAAILFGSISVGVEQIILITLGLTSISVFGLLIAIFIGIDLVSKEIERRTIYNILSKPVSRAEFILGKYLGLLLTLLVNTAIMTVGFYGALFYQKRALGPGDLVFLGAVYFILLQLAMVVGIAVVFSCISTPGAIRRIHFLSLCNREFLARLTRLRSGNPERAARDGERHPLLLAAQFREFQCYQSGSPRPEDPRLPVAWKLSLRSSVHRSPSGHGSPCF